MSHLVHPEADRVLRAAETITEPAKNGPERRHQPRYHYSALAALILIAPDGTRQGPLVVRGEDVSANGMAVLGSHPLRPGARGVMQLVRAGGRFALVGIEICHCATLASGEHR
ncbi:MAG: hypothetical protein ACYTGC_15430, partial [Planctomycetota bacterium]